MQRGSFGEKIKKPDNFGFPGALGIKLVFFWTAAEKRPLTLKNPEESWTPGIFFRGNYLQGHEKRVVSPKPE